MIAAIILAAGLSRRMGQPKLILPWGETTVISHIVDVFLRAAIDEILVVTGGTKTEIDRALSGKQVRLIFNPNFECSEMLDSLQVGLAHVETKIDAAIVALGDQPQIQLHVVRSLIDAYANHNSGIIVPSFQLKRGHPWLVRRLFWDELKGIRSPGTLRDFLDAHRDEIHYLQVTTDSILRDLDTPADYIREKPRQ